MVNQAQTHSLKKNPKKIESPFLCLNFKPLLVFLFLTLFISTHEQKQMKVKVRGTGERYFMYKYYFYNPQTAYVGNVKKGDWIKSLYCENEETEVTVNFEKTLDTVFEMFLHAIDVVEVDLTNLDLSYITRMDSMFHGTLNVRKITFGKLDISRITDMYRLFCN